MKATKILDLRNMSDAELKAQVTQHKETLVKLRFQQAVGELTNTSQFGTIRKDIARVKTVIRERELKAAKK
ncbi:MAG TPA: 50S ribosomal protein L29 [Candidatus Kapabacteria bacterium]|nr:50S ribosomal protein L29 [Candidatus Kapabacteria bacterium]